MSSPSSGWIRIRSLAARSTVAILTASARTASSFSLVNFPLGVGGGGALFSQPALARRELVAGRPPIFGTLVDIRGGTASRAPSRTPPTRHMSASGVTEVEPTTTADGGDDGSSAPVVEPDPKLVELRSAMDLEGVDVVLVPSDDPHLSEYVPDAYKRRAFLTNFNGSAGTAVVTAGGAYLWTDSRYFNEANLSLDPDHWQLMKQGLPKVPTIIKFLTELALEKRRCGSSIPLRVGIDPYVHPASFAKDLTDAFEAALGDFAVEAAADNDGDSSSVEESTPTQLGEIITLENNLIDKIWKDRPPVPTSPFRVHPIEYAGKTTSDKVAKIRKEMAEKKATMSVFSALDDVAYLFNVRATGDVETCPVGIGYATITNDDVVLYCDPAKVTTDDVKAHLSEAGVTLRPYEDVVPAIEEHVTFAKSNRVWIDKSRANYALCRAVPTPQLVDAQNAVTPMKACKNSAEIEGMRQAHKVDGAAMANFMAWLENAIVTEGRSVSEVEVDEVLTGFRAQQPGFVEVSFPTIAGVGSNGAIIHYSAAEGTDLLKHLDKSNPILIDSGGQYTYGTTDVTRTWHFGEPTPEFVDYYTRVLKGNIGVDAMIFPENTPGFVLDVFARKSLWEAGKDYGHGTGHGVGAALNVHEGPHSISPRWANKEAMKKGMVVSNEPGYYEDGRFGIRIENLLEVVYVDPADDVDEDDVGDVNGSEENGLAPPRKGKAPGEKTFLKFEKLTLIPIQKNLINVKIMTDDELDWVDSYHQNVLEKVGPLLEEGSDALAWLKKSCEKIDRSVR